MRFIFVWKDGTDEVVEGANVEDAATKAGYADAEFSRLKWRPYTQNPSTYKFTEFLC